MSEKQVELTEDEGNVLQVLEHYGHDVYMGDVGKILELSNAVTLTVFRNMDRKGLIAEEGGLCRYVNTAKGKQALLTYLLAHLEAGE